MRQNWKRWLLLLIVAAPLGYLLVLFLNSPRMYVQRTLLTTALPANSRQLTQKIGRWEGGSCPYASLEAFYSTDVPWEEVFAFFDTSTKMAGWSVDRTTATSLLYRWPFPNDKQQLSLMLILVQSTDPQRHVLDPMHSAETVYRINITYISDIDLFNSSICQD
jgi:hypothetical protein